MSHNDVDRWSFRGRILERLSMTVLAARARDLFALALFAVAVLLLFLKSPDAILHPQFWAEDGFIFFAQQLTVPWPLVFTPYSGYLHAIPRIVAWGASWFSPVIAPLVYNVAAILINAFCISFVSLRLKGWFAGPAVFLAFFIVPTVGDIFGTLTNVQWFVQFVIASVCLFPPQQDSRATWLSPMGFAALGLAALTGPFSILISVAAFFAKFVLRLPIPRLAPLITATGACVQIVVMLGSRLYNNTSIYELGNDKLRELGIERLHEFYLDTILAPFSSFHLVLLLLIFSITVAVIIDAVRRPSVAGSISSLLVSVGLSQPILAYLKQHGTHTLTATSHYFYFLSVVVIWVGWQLLVEYLPTYRLLGAACIVAAFGTALMAEPNFFRRQPLRDLKWASYAEQIRARCHSELIVLVNPVRFYFKVPAVGQIPCPES
jgi:hypothetical protein